MLRLIRRLLGTDIGPDHRHRGGNEETFSHRSLTSRPIGTSDRYFDSMSQMQAAISERDYETAAGFVRESLRCIPEWVRETVQDYGSLHVGSIPALQQGGTILALLNDREGLRRMSEIVASVPELEPWAEKVEGHRHDRRLFQSIQEVVTGRPNCRQTEVKGLIGEQDGRRVARLISYLEKAGGIVRVKAGRTYRLLPPDSADIPEAPPKRTVRSHRIDRGPPRLIGVDVESLTYIPLPRSPSRWEEAQVQREQATASPLEEQFEIRDADWRIAKVEMIPMARRPDPAFRRMHPVDSGLLMIDDLGNAAGLGQVEAAALRYNREGEVEAMKGLLHDIYRIGVHPLGQGLIAMSRDAVVHTYGDNLEVKLETSLVDAPEIVALRKRFEIPDEQLKNHIRCVALSHGANRYLFTAVDEAWCVDMNGQGLWGTRLPIKEGWAPAGVSSNESYMRTDVDRALSIMDLSLPYTPEDLRQRYRGLAKKWHPDLNPGDPEAENRMKALTWAGEVLTGVDSSALSNYTGATFVRQMDRSEVEVDGIRFTVSIGLHVGEIHASDWIYAAAFAAQSDAVYLAGYSGRVFLVDARGEAQRVYDIGSVPRRIVDTGDYLYLLTDTRLYVLRDDTLHALVDTFDGGDLIVAQTAFGLLEKKRLRWFREDGRHLGTVLSKDPIRRVYSTGEGMVVESRQRRALVEGVPTWWEPCK